MKRRWFLLLPIVACAACPTNLQQHARFAGAAVVPKAVPGEVGDVVAFEVRPNVPAGSEWSLNTHHRARFAGPARTSSADWRATGKNAIAFEAVVSPWDADEGDSYKQEAARGWLWFGLKDSGATQSFDRDLPILRLPFREIAPVTVTAAFSLDEREPRLVAGQVRDRMVVSFQTPVAMGFPYAPRTRAMLLETGGKRRLYAEVKMNYGDRPKERIGYEVSLSYPITVPNPVEVVIVQWLGHGWYYGPFEVFRTTIGGPPAPSPAASDAPAPPASTTVTTIPAVPVERPADGGAP